ncbi:MAG: alpha/beta fold hydrolase [Dehalococcoidia bacterium]
MTEESPGRQVSVNGTTLYVEEYGVGQPLVLVHGGTWSLESWRPLIPSLAGNARVIVFDSRGHGRSTNPSDELSYELLADDTAGLIDALGLERPFVGGWSDGGQVALELELRHPGLARGLIAGGVMHDFRSPEFSGFVRGMFCMDAGGLVDCDAMEVQRPVVSGWMKSAHKQSQVQWRKVAQQTAEMWLNYRKLTEDIVNRITIPTLVISGDRDGFTPLSHTIDFYQWIAGAELAILPGRDHGGVLQQPLLFSATVADFMARHQ